MQLSPIERLSGFQPARPEILPHEEGAYPHLKDSALLYQIYPFVFNESSDRKKGIGNIKGVIEKLPYLYELGVKMVWFTPPYPSPWKDGGYDVSNYKDIHPEFGTLEEFKELIVKAKEQGIDIMMDITLNHGSTEHELFKQAVSSYDNPAQNYFIFREANPDGSSPTNQASIFEGTPGSAWTPVEFLAEDGTKKVKYYFHKFTEGQPDWNLWNPDVHEMFQDVLRFWLDLGVKGFRFDVLHLTFEELADFSQKNPNYREGQNAKIDQWDWYKYYCRYPEVEKLIRNTIMPILNQYDALGVGEINSNDRPLFEMVKKSGVIPFNFTLLEETQTRDTFNATNMKAKVEDSIAALGDPQALMMADGNHDNLRKVDRIGEENAELLSLITMTLGGMAVIYNGDEFGMPNGVVPIERVRDPQFISKANPIDRDLARVPLLWDTNTKNGGFSNAPENALYLPPLPKSLRRGRSVAEQINDPHSKIQRHMKLAHLRDEYNDSLVRGDYIPLPLSGINDTVYSYIKQGRKNNQEELLVTLNFSEFEQDIEVPEGSVLFSTKSHSEHPIIDGRYHLLPQEGIIVKLAA